jgi:hypothetical protein
MLTMATAGLKPCATTGESSETDGGCAFCPAPADGFDAERGVPICYSCAEVNA